MLPSDLIRWGNLEASPSQCPDALKTPLTWLAYAIIWWWVDLKLDLSQSTFITPFMKGNQGIIFILYDKPFHNVLKHLSPLSPRCRALSAASSARRLSSARRRASSAAFSLQTVSNKLWLKFELHYLPYCPLTALWVDVISLGLK